MNFNRINASMEVTFIQRNYLPVRKIWWFIRKIKVSEIRYKPSILIYIHYNLTDHPHINPDLLLVVVSCSGL